MSVSAPFIWPAPDTLGDSGGFDSSSEAQHLLSEASTILGIISDLDSNGVEWLTGLFGSSSKVNSKAAMLILAVHAGCATRRQDLVSLLALQDQSRRRVKFRIQPMEKRLGSPSNCLVTLQHNGIEPKMLLGATPNCGMSGVDRTQVNIGFTPELTLFDRWRRWFDWAWLHSAQLSESAVEIPALVPARGTVEAEALWNSYCTLLSGDDRNESASIDPKTGEVTQAEAVDGIEDRTPTQVLKLPTLDTLARRVGDLLSGGKQVMIDSSSSVRPLDAPVSPDVLGEKAEQRTGTVVRRQSFRVSVFDKAELNQINAYRRGSQAIVEKLSVPLGKGVYWITDAMAVLLRKEIETKEEEAGRHLRRLVGTDANTFVQGKVETIRADFEACYREFRNGQRVPNSGFSRFLEDIESRIDAALTGRLVASVIVTKSSLSLPLDADDSESSWQQPWAQAEKLLLGLARFPREVISSPSRLRGLKTSRDEILDAINIADDAILTTKGRSQIRASDELRLVEWMSRAELEKRVRCEACLMLMDGQMHNKILDFIGQNSASD